MGKYKDFNNKLEKAFEETYHDDENMGQCKECMVALDKGSLKCHFIGTESKINEKYKSCFFKSRMVL